VGPDLTGRIEQRADQIDSEHHGEEGWTHEQAQAQATAELAGKAGGVGMPVYLSMQNPFVVGEAALGANDPKNRETYLTFDYEYADENDPESDIVGEKGTLVDFFDALRQESLYDFSDTEGVDEFIQSINVDHSEGISATDLDKRWREFEKTSYITDDQGRLARSELFRRALAHAGFDGIIDRTVNSKFGSAGPGMQYGKNMAGMDDFTVHYVAFKPTQIKSALGNTGTFDPTNPLITAGGKGSGNFGHSGRPGEVGGSASTGTDDGASGVATPTFRQWFSGSKVVDARGDPLEVYHGTDRPFGQFDMSRGGDTLQTETGAKNGVLGAFLTTDYGKASALYAGKRGVVLGAYLKIEHPLRLKGGEYEGDASAAVNAAAADYHDKPIDDLTEQDFLDWRDFLTRDGKDGIEVSLYDGEVDYIIFRPEQAKISQSIRDAAEWVARDLGGPGSGNFGHAGRPGEVGGSASDGASTVPNPAEADRFTEHLMAVARERSLFRETSLLHADADARADVKAIINSDLTKRVVDDLTPWEGEQVPDADKIAEAVRSNIDQWAKTSGDSDPDAVALQMATADVFNLDFDELGGHYDDTTIDDAKVSYETNKDVDRAFVSAEYDATQEFLKSQGIEYITVYRGGAHKDIHSGDQTVMLSPASSWTTNVDVAKGFAQSRLEHEGVTNNDLVVFAARVPASRVLSTCVTGRGCLTEHEVVLVGGKTRVRAVSGIENPASWSARVHKLGGRPDQSAPANDWDEVPPEELPF